ncbi:MAG: nucleoside-diphosphate sugar epimerase/dehydratase, partial [Geminicoccaceae bacterium]
MALNILLRDEGAQPESEHRIAVSESSAAIGLVVIDLAFVAVVFLALALSGIQSGSSLPIVLGQLLCFVVAKALLGLYPGHGMAGAERMRNVVLAIGAGLLVNAGLLFLIMRSGIVLTDHAVAGLLIGAVALGGSDPVGRRVLHRFHRWQEPVFIFGGGEAAAGLVRQLSLYPQLGFRAVCVVDDSSLYIADEHQGIPIIRFRELGAHSEQLAITTTA